MTKTEIHEQYEVGERGIICSPGKFEGEQSYSPYFWDKALNGEADEDTFTSYSFFVTDEDKAEFSDLQHVWKVDLMESDDGFVYCIAHFG